MNTTAKSPRRLSVREVSKLSGSDPREYFRMMESDRLEFRRDLFSLWAMTSDPDVVQHVLLTNARNYRKSRVTRLLLEPPLGKYTLFTSEGERWKRQRRFAAPAFAVKTIEGFAPLMVDEAQRLLQRWEQYPDSGHQIKVQSEMSDLTLKIILRAMFSIEADEQSTGNIADAVAKFAKVRLQLRDALGVPTWIPKIQNIRLRPARKVLNDTAKKIILQRQLSGENKADLLGMLMASVDDETGNRMSVRQLQDEVRSYFIAGYETTATTLTWVFYALHRHPDVEAKLHRELDSVLNGRLPELSDLPNLPYTLQVIQETMRLYTVIPSLGRQAIEEDEVKGMRIPKKAAIQINIWTMHRDERWWERPLEFNPERFAESSNPSGHRFAYLPFGGGPRICIGAKFSLLEAHLLLAAIAQSWRLCASHYYTATPVGQIVLQPEDRLPMTLERRK